jgi:peptide/nickel transport system permease protein
MPLLVATFGGIAGIARYVRNSMVEVLESDFILFARAKGLPERKVLYRHALRNALLPLITILGLSLPGLIGGSVIFESIFGIPGVGQLMWQAVLSRDYPVILANLVLVSVLTLLGNFLADIGYALADPRIRTGGRT